MTNLNEKMQERLDKWRKSLLPSSSEEKKKEVQPSRRNGKGDFGDAQTLEDWEDECRRSQSRR